MLATSVSTAPSRRAARVPRDEARRRILAAAGVVLERGGFAALNVDAVMAEAGLARTAFYRHFDGRGDVVAALLEELAGALAPEIAPSEDLSAVDDAGGLRELLDVGVELARRHGALLRAADEARHVDPQVRRASDAFSAFLVRASMELVRARAHVPGAATPPVGEDVVRAPAGPQHARAAGVGRPRGRTGGAVRRLVAHARRRAKPASPPARRIVP